MSEEKKFKISKQEVNDLPLWRYEGPILQLETEEEFEEAASLLGEVDLIGMDTETRPAFRKGECYKVALIQLALPDMVYLLRLNQHGLPDPIRAVLEDPAIRKVGVGPRDDIRELKRDFDCELEGVIDLNKFCSGRGYQSIGARNLTALVLGKRISKSQQTSNWEAPTLSNAQKAYAAADAWICQEIYRELEDS